MEVKVITVPFKKDKNGFDGKELEEFVSKVEILEIKSNFFIDEIAYWTYSIIYNKKKSIKSKEVGSNLVEKDQKLYNVLKEWRNKKVLEKGFPPYLIATNKQLEKLAKERPKTIEGFKLIDGLGNKKANDYGKDIFKLKRRKIP